MQKGLWGEHLPLALTGMDLFWNRNRLKIDE